MFRILIIIMWCMFAALCLFVINTAGWDDVNLFFSDISAGSWRAVFNVDFIIHLLLVAGWVAWKEKYSFSGVILAVFCFCGGALFSLLYLLYLSVVNRGDLAKVLLGKHAIDPSFAP